MSQEEKKAIVCRLLKEWRASTLLHARLGTHFKKFDIDLSVFRSEPLMDAAYDIVYCFIDDVALIEWWICHAPGFDAYQPSDKLGIVTIKTAEELWDYYFKNKGAVEAQN